MSDTVRVKDPISGAEYDVPLSRLVVCPGLIVLDKPTGQRTKPNLPLGTPLPGGEAERRRASKKTPAANKSHADNNDGQSVATEEEN